jgi:hypothetical protein
MDCSSREALPRVARQFRVPHIEVFATPRRGTPVPREQFAGSEPLLAEAGGHYVGLLVCFPPMGCTLTS